MKSILVAFIILATAKAQHSYSGYDYFIKRYYPYQQPEPAPVQGYSYLPPQKTYLPPPVNTYLPVPPTTPSTTTTTEDPCIMTIQQEWERWKMLYNKTYTGAEHERREAIFIKNAMLVNDHNDRFKDGLEKYEMEKNEFTDMEYREVIKMKTGFIPELEPCENCMCPDDDILTTIHKIPKSESFNSTTRRRRSELCDKKMINDTAIYETNWVTNGSVTPVKDQELCGSCWAFAAAGVIEAQHYRNKRELVPLSVQNLVDCVPPEKRNGCNGGSMTEAFAWIRDRSGINVEEKYPYVGKKLNEKLCRFNEKDAVGKVKKVHELKPGNEKHLKEYQSRFRRDVQPAQRIKSGSEEDLLKKLKEVGPIAVAIFLTDRGSIQYKTGVFYDEACEKKLHANHAVLLVGYGETPKGQKFWLVKNSWGKAWGENGYMKIARGEGNHCEIATYASYAE